MGCAVEPDIVTAVRAADGMLIAVPSHGFRECLTLVAPLLRPGMRVAWATKGFELDTGKLPHQVASEVLGPRACPRPCCRVLRLRAKSARACRRP